jgi:diguanylate cyclase (GGDEF)-like protein/PAS domain S-box-containing protein
MLVLSGYENLVQLHSGERSRIYRGYSLRDAKSVILKVPQSDYPITEQLQRYRQEYRLTHRLKLPNVIRSYRLEERARTLAIVFEDFGGIALDQLLKSSPEGLSIDRFFNLALAITEALGQLHSQNVIHKDLNPKNIVFNVQSNLLKLIDLGISHQLNPENFGLEVSPKLEGTLAYLSPEQTGRITQALDHRTDFYALGVTFFELLTGQLPFISNDPMELVYWHLVKQPPWFRDRTDRQIPEGLEAIVRKLMAKNVDDRFQSIWGLKADLEHAQSLWQSQGQVQIFALGEQDIPDRLQIPQMLYGREAELEVLGTLWDHVSQTAEPIQSTLVVIQGDVGVGKSALARSLQSPLSSQRQDFIVGKFDPFQVTIPYCAIASAFAELVKQRLTEPEPQVELWRSKLLKAFGSNGQVLTTIIPDMELILGPQAPVPDIGGPEGQNRFLLVFRQFVEACCQADRPLVLVLEDGQWADSDTLHLLEYLLADPIPYFLPLILVLDREVSPHHPLPLSLERLTDQNVHIQVLSLNPLTLEQVTHFLRDTLQQDFNAVQPLAEVVYQKTQGNPLILRQFLSNLYQERHLYFQPSVRRWQWDLSTLRRMDIVENVVEVVLSQLEALPPTTQKILGIAACFGILFDLIPLSWVNEQSPRETAEQLQKALDLGLILPRSPLEEEGLIQHYQFSHERIQKAAYSLIAPPHRSQLHYGIGRKLLTRQFSEQHPEQIFEIVSHLNRGIDILQDDRERLQLAQLNLKAAAQAKAATAYETGLNYAQLGVSILGEQGWVLDQDLTLDLHEMEIQLLGLCGQWDAVNSRISSLEERNLTPLDLVNFYRCQIQFKISQHQFLEAIDMGIAILKKLGFDLPEQPSEENIKAELLTIDSLLENRSIQDLAQLPPMGDRQQMGITEMITSLVSPTYLCGSSLFPLVVALSVRLSIQYGNIISSGFVYGCYGILACNFLKNVPLGREFGELALSIAAQKGNAIVRPQVLYIITAFILQRTAHLQDHIHLLNQAYSFGLEVVNLEYGGYAYQHLCLTLFALGRPLDEVAKHVFCANNILPQLDQHTPANYCKIYAHAISILKETGNSNLLIDHHNSFHQAEFYEKLETAHDRLGLCLFHFFRLSLACFFSNWDIARQESNAVQPYLVAALGLMIIPLIYFYDSLAVLADLKLEQSDFESQWQRIESNQIILQTEWVAYAPMNYQHKFDLIEAEKYRVLKEYLKAIDAYDRAIAGAKDTGFLQDEALANERAAEFYLNWGKQTIARTYLQEAYYIYIRWGAAAKAQALKAQYSQFLETPQRWLKDQPQTLITTEGADLDLQTLIKASQAITQEIVFDDLIQTLIRILRENTGAEICALLLADSPLDNHLSLPIYSREDGIKINPTMPLEELLAQSIVSYVNRTGESVIIADIHQAAHFGHDSYLQKYQPQSILCYPLLKQGNVIGIVYLENRLIQGAFSSDRLRLLELLSGQIVIALQNSQMYAELQGNKNQLQQFLEAVPLGIGIIDRHGTPRYTNRMAKEILGKGVVKSTDPHNISQVYQNYIAGTNEIYPPDQLPIVKALRGEFSTTEDIEIHRGDRVIPLEAWGTPIYDENGTIQYGMAVFQDISERRRAEQILQDSENRYRVLAEMSPVGIFRNNLRGECIYTNPKLQQMTGLSQEEFLGEGWSRMIYPADRQKMYQLWSNFVTQAQQNFSVKYQAEYRYITMNGSIRWAVVEALPERDSTGEIIGFIGATIDIHDRKEIERILSDYSHSLEEKVKERTTALAQINKQLEQEILERKSIEEALRHSQEQLQQITNSVNAGIAYMDANLRYRFVNKIYAQQFGKTCELIQGKQVWEVIGSEAYQTMKPIIDRVLQGEPQSTELEVRSSTGKSTYLNLNLTPEFNANHEVEGYYLVFFNITERKRLENSLQKANNQLKRLANLDGLTQVANRRKFDEYLTQEWYRHLRTRQPLSLILFDVDDFKRYNDSYGHQKGDDCLIQITQAVKTVIQRSTDLLARYGGEEFVIILANTPASGAIAIARQIQTTIRALEIPHLNSRASAIVSVSLGIASIIPSPEFSPEDLIEQADQALYEAKAAGRDRYIIRDEIGNSR